MHVRPAPSTSPSWSTLSAAFASTSHKKIANTHRLVNDPTTPDVNTTSNQLLKHARVYVLADKFGMAKLRELAHSKVYCIKSSAKGEIAYARYVYATTPKEDDTTIRPVTSFWAHRSHVLRAEAEDEFRQMCLELPRFSFDVISKSMPEERWWFVIWWLTGFRSTFG